MPVTTFSEDNVRRSPTDFPKLKLRTNEKARVVCIEKGPTFEWVHTLQKPAISKVNGKPVMESKKKRNGENYETYQMDFIGRPICLGDPDILEDRGSDPDHCPACKLAKESDMLRPPERRYAIHVLQYATKTGSTEITKPFAVQTRVWTLTENRYAKIVEIMREDGVTDPRRIDLLLGPCEPPEDFQKYEIHAGSMCEMLADEDRTRVAAETYRENHAPDLAPYCGRQVDSKLVAEDCEQIVEAWQRVRRAEQGGQSIDPLGSDDDVSGSLDSSLLDSVGTGAAPAGAASTEEKSTGSVEGSGLDEFLAETTHNTEEEAKAAAPASSVQSGPATPEPEKSEPAKPAKRSESFEELLASLPGSGGSQ
jgi:hypothetical protein